MDIRVVSSRNATALGDEVVGTAYIQGGKRHGPYENPSGVIFDAVVLHTVASQDNCTFFFFEGILPLDGSEFAASCARLDQPPEALTLRFEEDPSAPGEAVLGKSGRLVGEYRRDWEEPGVPSEVYEVEIHSFLPFYSPCVEGGGYPPLDAGVDP